MSAKAFVKHEAAEQEDVDQQDVVEQKADSKPYYQPSVRQHRILLVTVFLLVLTEEIHQLNTKLASTAAARDRDSLQADKNGMAGAVQALQLKSFILSHRIPSIRSVTYSNLVGSVFCAVYCWKWG